MNKKLIFLFLSLTFIQSSFCQTFLYGINLDKDYSDIKLSKETVLKDQSVFYSVKISSFDFVFSTVKSGFDPFKHPEKYYNKGLQNVKRVFGEPIKIFIDTSKLKLSIKYNPTSNDGNIKKDTVLFNVNTGGEYPYNKELFKPNPIPNTSFYVWKFKRKTGNYFIVYYGLSGFGLSLNIRKFDNEEQANNDIKRIISEAKKYDRKDYIVISKDLNITEW